MLIGHWGVALAVGAARKGPGLGTAAVAAQLSDILFMVLVLAGVESYHLAPGATAMNWLWLDSVPYSHSLAGASVQAAAFSALIWLVTRRRLASVLSGVAVLSHFILDLLVHRPDMTLAGSPPMLGSGLWNYPSIERPLELSILVVGAAAYLRSRRVEGAPGWRGLVVLLVILVLLQGFEWYGPRSTSAGTATAASALAIFAAIAGLCAWIDRRAPAS